MKMKCNFCGDDLPVGLQTFGICPWCMKESDDRQKKMEEYDSPMYCGDKEDYKGEVDFG